MRREQLKGIKQRDKKELKKKSVNRTRETKSEMRMKKKERGR